MNKKVLSLALILSLVFLSQASYNMAAEKKFGDSKGQILCPVMESKIDKKYFVDYKGKRIYFCCPSCEKDFMKDPDKYMEKLKGVKLDEAAKSGKK